MKRAEQQSLRRVLQRSPLAPHQVPGHQETQYRTQNDRSRIGYVQGRIQNVARKKPSESNGAQHKQDVDERPGTRLGIASIVFREFHWDATVTRNGGNGAFAPFVRPTLQSDSWRHDRARIVS